MTYLRSVYRLKESAMFRQAGVSVLAAIFMVVTPAAWSASAPVIYSTVINTALNQITITGQNLSPTSMPPGVAFNSQNLTLVSFTNTTVVANLPASLQAGSYALVVVNSNKQAATFSVAFGTV